MLARVRNVVHRTTIAAFSTSACQFQQAAVVLEAMDTVGKILLDAGAEHLSSSSETSIKPFIASKNSLITPHDLTRNARLEFQKRRKRPDVAPPAALARYYDCFHQLDIDPLKINPQYFVDYITDMGKIMPRSETRLTSKSQRRMGKAIRRAKMMGILPMFSKPHQHVFAKRFTSFSDYY